MAPLLLIHGATVALRLALHRPEQVSQLILAWPATAGDERVDARQRQNFGQSCGFSPTQADAPLKLLPGCTEIGSPGPESPRPDFHLYLDAFADAVRSALPSR
jgi:pimeloyl-ACP methyl ester carboxylesterase